MFMRNVRFAGRPAPAWVSPGASFHIKAAAGWGWVNGSEFPTFGSLIREPTAASFSRAGPKYGLNSLGEFVLFSENEPARTDLGLWLESEETGLGNYALRSEAWSVSGGAQVERIEDIFGSGATWSTQFVANGASSQHYSNIASATLVATTSYTVFAIVQNPTSGFVQLCGGSSLFGTQAFVNFDLNGNGSIGTFGTNVTDKGLLRLTNGRFLIWFKAPATASATGTFGQIALVPSASSTRLQASTSSASIIIHAGQISAASRWGSPIYTFNAGPVSRAADVFTIKPPAGTYGITYKFGDGTADQTVNGVVIGSGGYTIPANLNGRLVTDIIAFAA